MTISNLHLGTQHCCCEGCMGELAQDAADVDFTLDPSNTSSGTSPGDYDKPVWSAYQTAQHLARSGATWADDGNDPGDFTEVTYRFRDAEATGNPDHVFEAVNQQHTREILDQFAEVAQIEFREVTDDAETANINFQYRDGANGGGYWNGSNVVVSRVSWNPEMDVGTYNRRLMLHEIGHAMGFSHPGNYNGNGSNYADDALYWNDTRQFSNMSYWVEGNSGAQFGHMSTLALHDILALQIEYGVNTSTRTGDETYGFNATAGNAYDFTSTRTNSSGSETENTNMAFSIWDADGNDTLDFSGSNTATELDLRQGSFSSTNGQTYNVSIAYGAVIENGVGSDHDDTLRGNDADNSLYGGKGNDTIFGGADDINTEPDPRAFVGMSINEDPNIFDQRLQVEDINAFSTGAFTIDMMVNITRMSAGQTTFVSYATDHEADTFLVQGQPNGMLRIEIDGEFIDTDIETLSLIDGQSHRLSVGWQSDNGELKVHIDGAVAWTGVLQTGATLGTGGTLVFGQDQDRLGGGFDSRQTFQGTIGDIRIFDTLRSTEDIAQDAFTAPDGNPPVHHWVASLEDGAVVADVGRGGLVDLIAANPDNVSATQSSQYRTNDASLVLDGDLNTYNHTQNGATETLTVTFDDAVTASYIEVINRNSSTDRLNDAIVQIYDDEGRLVQQYDPIIGAGSRSPHGFEVPADVSIGEIRIISANEYLHVAEVRVFGQGAANSDLSIIGDAQLLAVGQSQGTPTDRDTVFGGDGQDQLFGGFGNDRLNGDNGADTIDGGAGHDRLFGGNGNDKIDGGLGNDWLFGGTGADAFDGGGGTDTVSYAASGQGVWVNLSNGTASGGDATGDTFTGVERVEGSSESDVLIGNGARNILYGGAGSDRLDGGGGADRLSGGLGNDFYIIDNSGDTIVDEVGYSAGGGIDTVRSFVNYVQPDNIELVRLGYVTDTQNLNVTGNSAPGTLIGNAGQNAIIGGYSSDQINGNDGNDAITGGNGRDTLVGGAGADTFIYLAVSDSDDGALNRDLLNGFTHGQDRIDLRAIDANWLTGGNGTFDFIGGAKFSGTAGELRTQGLGGPDAILVEGDNNGDGQADFQILINGTHWMTGTDFLL